VNSVCGVDWVTGGLKRKRPRNSAALKLEGDHFTDCSRLLCSISFPIIAIASISFTSVDADL
ncbi:TPA: hypothetical protein ACPZPM_004233, partial [Yersinia enterocolitica]